jgi:mycothiol synthase
MTVGNQTFILWTIIGSFALMEYFPRSKGKSNMSSLTDNIPFTFDPSLSLRPARLADAEAVAQLTLDICTSDGDPTAAMTTDELRNHWQTPGFDFEKNTWVVENSEGHIVGYEELVNRHAHASLVGDGYVHPDFLGMGVGTTMLRALEGRAREEMTLAESDLRVFIRNGMSAKDTIACEMHEAEGYTAIRFQWTMEINLDNSPAPVVWPAGIQLRRFDLGEHNYALHRAHEEAFGELWGRYPHSYEDWKHRMTAKDDFDPSNWFIAWDGNDIAAYALCSNRMGIGYVGSIGVRKPWRNRGLGLVLLNHSFTQFYEQNVRTIRLSVDAANPTGATRLYERAGMHVAAQYVVYEKELRPVREIAS